MTSPYSRIPLLIASACTSLTLLVSLSGCNSKPAAPVAPTAGVVELAESDLVTVSSGDIEQTLRANGTLRARHESLVRSRVVGEVLSVDTREGERVTAGQTLAKIDDLEYRARVDERRAALEGGRAQSRLAETTRNKNEELKQKNFLSSLAYDNAQSAAKVAQSQVLSLEAQLTLAEKSLKDTQVLAPISGWIAKRYIQRGDKVSPDTPLFSIVDLSHLELEALVPANEISRVSIGQKFKAHVEGFPDQQYTGRVSRIGAQALHGSRAITIFIDIDNPDAALKDGLFAEGTLVMGQRDAQARVPLTALHSETGLDFVYAIVNGQVHRRSVKTGLRSETAGAAEILEGLEAGMRIVAVNLGPLKEGATVRVITNSPSSLKSTPSEAVARPGPGPDTSAIPPHLPTAAATSATAE